jgi:hypothetical protein
MVTIVGAAVLLTGTLVSLGLAVRVRDQPAGLG